ncbi:MAG: glycosyltransferase [Dysgonamonadaceae bacterium]|nr:glycosyltransferase [Dysgonamonadaceae bacterium]
MKISVITTSYNCASTIRETIDSVLAQDYIEIQADRNS